MAAEFRPLPTKITQRQRNKMISYSVLALRLRLAPEVVVSWIEKGLPDKEHKKKIVRLPAVKGWHDWFIYPENFFVWARKTGVTTWKEEQFWFEQLRLLSCLHCNRSLVDTGCEDQAAILRRLSIYKKGPPLPQPIAGWFRNRPLCRACFRQLTEARK